MAALSEPACPGRTCVGALGAVPTWNWAHLEPSQAGRDRVRGFGTQSPSERRAECLWVL